MYKSVLGNPSGNRLTYPPIKPQVLHWKDTLPDWYIKEYGRQPCVNIGTAGHVDHGKTTLVQALTGVWTSAHSQELKRGITIRVGYADAAFYKCDECEDPLCYSVTPTCTNCGKESKLTRVVSFVDSPGHESLMANMLSGSALMDGAILVVAANAKVPQPQTKEHLLALQTLGIKEIVVVQNKADLVSYEDALQNYEDIEEFIKKTSAQDAPIIPVSAQSKINMEAVISAIESSISTPKRKESDAPIMHVLRSFDVNKPGTKIQDIKGGVIGGSLTEGVFKEDEEVEVRPGLVNEKSNKYDPIVTQISSLGTGAGIVDTVKPGGLVAIGTNLDPSLTRSDQLIGSVVGKPGKLPDNSLDAKIKVMLFDTAVGTTDEIKVNPIQKGESLRFNIGTAPNLGQVTSCKKNEIEVKFRRPVCLFKDGSVAISRRIGDRWRLIGAGTIVG